MNPLPECCFPHSAPIPHQFVMKVYVDEWIYVTEKFVNMGNIELYEGVLRYEKADYPPYSNLTGTEILFGGTTLEREAGSTIHITCSLSLESGEAAVFLRSGADDPVILLSESGEYDGTIEVDGTSTYIGVWGDQAEGTVSIEIE